MVRSAQRTGLLPIQTGLARNGTGHRQVVDLVWCCQDRSVAVGATYKGYRYPIEVIGHAVWLYHRFALSLRDVEELLLARGAPSRQRWWRVAEPEMHHRAVSVVLNCRRAMRVFRLV
jgi:hypothetical protein